MVRHGETDWNRQRRFQGRADQPLNEAGRGQARELAELLHGEPVSAVYTSPLRRALETAEILAGNFGLRPEPLDALLEIDVGAWEGLTIDEVRTTYPGRVDEDWRIVVDVDQTIRSLDGSVLRSGHVRHAYTLRDGLITRMEILQ